MNPQQEKKNRRIGLIVSGGVHIALLLLFIFLMAWREPNPPLPEYGIEINFGTSEVGTGETQPEQTNNDLENLENTQEEETQLEEPVEESVKETADAEEEEITEETQNEKVTATEDVSSPEVVEEKIKESRTAETEKETEDKQQVTPSEQEKIKEQVQGEKTDNEDKATSHGDNVDKEGDKGDKEGTLDARALYGNKGGGDGTSLELAGWVWDFRPNPDDQSNESGKIVFEITIDDRGEILGVKTLQTTVSPSVEKIYKDEVRKLTFSKTSENSRPAPVSKGKITFIIKAR